MKESNPRDLLQAMDARYGLFGFFFAFGNRLQTAGDHFYDDITCKQFFLLACLNLFPDRAPTVYELSNIMGCSHQNTKQLINKLVEKDYLCIEPDATDKRKLLVRITKHAAEVGANYEAKQNEFITQLFDGVSEQEASNILTTLLKMEQNLIKLEDK